MLEQFTWRYATKRFNAEVTLSEEQVFTVTEAMRLAPSSYGLQPYHIYSITRENEELRTSLRAAAWDQPQLTEASHIIVLAVLTNLNEQYIDQFIELKANERKIPVSELDVYSQRIKNYVLNMSVEERVAWAKKQTYIALGFGLATAAQLEIDSCPMEGFEHGKFDQLLGLTEQNLQSTVLLALGERSPEDATSRMAKVRFARDQRVHTL